MSRLFISPTGDISLESRIDKKSLETKSEGRFRAQGEWIQFPSGYDFIDQVGKGAMGIVLKARQAKSGDLIAIKILNPVFRGNFEYLRRLENEAAAIAAIQHPNIVRLHEVGECEGLPFLALEFIEGGSLLQSLRSGPLDPRTAAELLETLARAIHFMHQRQIIHRDLKPGNILLTQNGEPKITDFGMARLLQREKHLTATGMIVGTPAYMAPEQARGDSKRIGPPTDIFALGVILYELLTNRQPFAGETAIDMLHEIVFSTPPPPVSLNSKAPRDLDAICMTCLQKDPQQRYADAEELADELHRFLSGQELERTRRRRALALDSKAGIERLRKTGLEKPTVSLTSVKSMHPGSRERGAFSGSNVDIELFRGLSAEQVEALLQSGRYYEFQAGESVFDEGDPADGLYAVIEGRIITYKHVREDEIYLAQLGRGEVFGEIGLVLSAGVRTASARALEKSTILQLPGNPLKLAKLFSDSRGAILLMENLLRILWKRLRSRERQRSLLNHAATPRFSEIFSSTDSAIEVFRSALPNRIFGSSPSTRRLQSGRLLFAENDASDALYFLHHGSLEVVRKSGDEGNGQALTITAPAIVGELAFLLRLPRSASVKAVRSATYTSFTRADFEKLQKRDPSQAVSIMFSAAQTIVHLILQSETKSN